MKLNCYIKFEKSQHSVFFVFSVLISLLTMLPKLVLSQYTNAFEKYYFHINDYPNDATPNWGDNSWAANGITHDDDNWYICSVDRTVGLTTAGTDWILWKIPISEKLDQDFDNNPNTNSHKWRLSFFRTPPDTFFKKYGHAGDIDICEDNNGVKYIILPLTGGGKPIIAFIRARDLHFINYAFLDSTSQSDVGWCAFSNGHIYTSKDEADSIFEYSISWNIILNHPRNHHGISKIDAVPLKGLYEDRLKLFDMQGGEFSPEQKLLYVVNGVVRANGSTDYREGIHVFKKENSYWQEVQKSTNQNRGEWGCFDYSFDNGDALALGEEPEGLTIWDIDAGRAPYIRGQLHVLIDDHNFWSSNKVTLKHFKEFNCSPDITIYGTTPNGEPKSSSSLRDFLRENERYADCSSISNNAPSIFPPGKTNVLFWISDSYRVRVECEASVNIVAEYDECSRAMQLPACDPIITNNYCAGYSKNIPAISGYNGLIKDVWFKINPPSSKTPSFSIETYQVTGGLTHTVIQVLKGTCGRLHEIASDDGSTNGGQAKVTLQNIYGSDPLYVRVTDYGGDDYAKFGIYYKKIATGSEIFSQQSLTAFPTEGESVFNRPLLKGDLNNDGKMDLIFQYQNSNGQLCVRTKISDGLGGFTTNFQNLGDDGITLEYPTLTGDIDGDGKTDLILTYVYDNNLRIRVNFSNGDGTFRRASTYPFSSTEGASVFNRQVLTGDVNADGKADLIFQYKSTTTGKLMIRTKISRGDGSFDMPDAFDAQDGETAMSHPTIQGDFNGDGKSDLLLAYYYTGNGLTVRTKFAKGDGSYGASDPFVLGDGNGVFDYPTLTGDVDGDGKTDLIFVGQDWGGNTNLNVRVKFSNGDGTFREASQVLGDGAGVHTYPTLTGDVNGDGKTDLIFAGDDWTACGLNIRVKISDGLGGWCPDWQGTGEGASVLRSPFAGDINGDGKTDLIFPYHLTNEGLKIRTKITKSNYACNNQDAAEQSPIVASSEFLIYPNPSGNYFQIRAVNQQTVQLKIINTQGVTLAVYPRFNTDIDRVDVSRFQSGIYFVELFNSETKERSGNRFVKIN